MTERERLAALVRTAFRHGYGVGHEDADAYHRWQIEEAASKYIGSEPGPLRALLREQEREACGFCDGYGTVGRQTPNPEQCPDCGGSGYAMKVREQEREPDGWIYRGALQDFARGEWPEGFRGVTLRHSPPNTHYYAPVYFGAPAGHGQEATE